jgi:hypothetical protein
MSRHSVRRDVRGVVRVAGLALTTASVGVLAVGASPATAKPRVFMEPALEQVTAGYEVKVRYSSRGVPASSSVEVQRPDRTRHVWRTVKVVPRNGAGVATLPTFPTLGQYPLRIAAIRHGKVLAAWRTSQRVYGDVPLGTLLNRGDRRELWFPAGTRTTTGSLQYHLFRYLFRTSMSPGFGGYVGASYSYTTLTVWRSPCRSVHLDWIASGPPTSAPWNAPAEPRDLSDQQGAVSLREIGAPGTHSPGYVLSSASGNRVASLDLDLVVGASWVIAVGQTSGPFISQTDGPFIFDWYFNGAASCYSDHPVHVTTVGEHL